MTLCKLHSGSGTMCLLTLALLLSGRVFSRAADASAPGRPLRVCLVSGSAEYHSSESLARLERELEAKEGILCSRAFGNDKGTDLPGLEALEKADVMVLFTRRLVLPPEQLAMIRRYVDAGRPIVGIRTASHAIQNWQPDVTAFDREVLGGSYSGHYEDRPAKITLAEDALSHPVLAGVTGFTTTAKLYKNPVLAEGVKVLLRGQAGGDEEPVAWVRERKGGRVFYTSLGAPGDFEQPAFRRLLINAIKWAAAGTDGGKDAAR